MPRIKFTALKIKNLKLAPSSVECVDDSREKGSGALGLRVSPKGKRTWFLAYSTGAHTTKRVTLGSYSDMSLANARDASINIMAKINPGNDPQQQKADYRAAEAFSDLQERT